MVPVIAIGIEYTITPLFVAMGMDPAIAVSSILAPDTGGLPLSLEVSQNELIAKWASLVYGSMMGTTIVFSIPVGLAAIQKKNINAFAKGILYGLAAIPFGSFVGGIIMNIPILTILINLIPAIIFSIIIIVCLILWQNRTISVFKWISVGINVCAILGLILAMINDLVLIPLSSELGYDATAIPFFNLLAPTTDGILIAGGIGLILAGALPLVACLAKWLKKPLAKLSKKTGMSDVALMGFLLTSANNMAMFETTSKMKEREITINVAFSVCAAFILGDHLAFTASNAPECMVPMMVGKIISAIAVWIAVVLTRKKDKNKPNIENSEKDKEKQLVINPVKID